MKSTVLKKRKQSVCLLFCCLVAVIFLTGCMDAMNMLLFTTGTGLKPLPDVDYTKLPDSITKRDQYKYSQNDYIHDPSVPVYSYDSSKKEWKKGSSSDFASVV